VLEQPGLNVGYLAYNTTKKPFDDVRVRKAVNMAIDKKAIVDAVYLGTAFRPPTRFRRRCGRTTRPSRTTPSTRLRPRNCWPQPV
jgi:ABC-type transport system substrate-binding protein